MPFGFVLGVFLGGAEFGFLNIAFSTYSMNSPFDKKPSCF